MSRHYQTLLLVSVAALGLTSCDQFQKKDPLPGERVSYLNMAGLHVQADPELRKSTVTLPKARKLESFPQATSNFDHSFVPYEVSGKSVHSSFEPTWKTSIGSGTDAERVALSHPVSNEKHIFVSDAHGKVSAINIHDGSVVWTMHGISEEEAENAMPINLSYHEGKVFAATSVGSLFALDAANGQILWSVNLGAPARVMPGVKDGRVFVTTIDGRTHAYGTKSGELLWDHQGLNDITNILGGASPVIKDDIVIVTYSSGELYALKTDNGAVVWSDTITTSLRTDSISSIPHIVGNPIIEGHILYVTSHGGKTMAYDLTTGLTLWQQDIGSVKAPLLIGNYLFVLESRNRLICLEKTTGKIYWITVLPLDKDNKTTQWSSPMAVNDRIVLGSQDGRVVFLDPKQGLATHTMDVKDPVVTQPIVAGSKIIYTLESGTIAAQ